MKTLPLISLCCSLLLIGVLAGCGGGGTGLQPVPTGEILLRIALPSPDTLPLSRSIGEIAAFRITIIGAGAPQVVTVPWTPPTALTQRMTVRASEDVAVAVDALDEDELIHYHGEATVVIPAGMVTPVELTLVPVSAEVALDTTIHTGEPGLTIDEVPPVGASGYARGTVTGKLDPEVLAVAVYIKVNGGWWNKPYFNAPLTFPHTGDGQWQCAITTGGSDAAATDVAAFLVYRDAQVPLIGGGALPDIPQALAVVQVARPQPAE